MKRAALLALLLVVSSTVLAQEAPRTDYSRDSLMRLFREGEERPPIEPRFRWHVGYVEFRALDMDWRIAYIPILPPLPGSVPRTNREMIDPFTLTGTQFATTPRTFNQRRVMSSELRRIERTDRARARIGSRQ